MVSTPESRTGSGISKGYFVGVSGYLVGDSKIQLKNIILQGNLGTFIKNGVEFDVKIFFYSKLYLKSDASTHFSQGRQILRCYIGVLALFP